MGAIKDLAKHFKEHDVEWRMSQCGLSNRGPWGIILKYVDARAVQQRLDDVLGPQNWKDEYVHIQNNVGEIVGVKCKLSIFIIDKWITKEDGSEETDIEGFKGGFSKSLVRAAVKWGIGRYLYDTPTTYATFVNRGTKGSKPAKINGQMYYWIPPNTTGQNSNTNDLNNSIFG